jgi:hypothetical protein
MSAREALSCDVNDGMSVSEAARSGYLDELNRAGVNRRPCPSTKR